MCIISVQQGVIFYVFRCSACFEGRGVSGPDVTSSRLVPILSYEYKVIMLMCFLNTDVKAVK